MPLPSLHVTGDGPRAWSVPRVAIYGAGIGALAALVKSLVPALHATGGAGGSWAQIPIATVGFAVLCAAAAGLRNFIARRLIWPEIR